MEWDPLFGQSLYRGGRRLPTQQQQQQQQQHPDALSQQQHPDALSQQQNNEVRQLQAEVNQLRAQLEESQERVEELEELEEQKQSSKPPSKPSSHFAAKENPIVMPDGFIDGRSNAHAAFAQKCDLLREFKAEFGHCAVPPNPPPKYAKLPNFLMKQRKYYRFVQKDPTCQKISPERIAMLEEIGVEWYKHPAETWRENFEKLKELKEKYGHCCIGAVESFDDPKMVLWTNAQRTNLRESGLLQENACASKSNNNAANQEESKEEEPIGENNKEDESPQSGDENKEDDEDPSQNRPKKKKKRNPVPVYWTDEMRNKLLSLNCPWLESFEDSPRAKNATKKGILNSRSWYDMLEQFRAYVAEHGNGLVPIKNIVSGLPKWVREQRRVYDLVKDGKLDTCDVFEANFELLKSLGFVFDHDVLRKEEERLIKLQAEDAARKRVEESTAGKLEAAKRAEKEAEKALETAKNKVKEANSEVKAAKAALAAAKTAVRKAQTAVKLDPVGKTVRVKPRGDGNPGGLAKVLAIRRTMVVGQELSLYDVEFLDSGEKAFHVDGMFVEQVDEGLRMLTAAVEEVSQTTEAIKPPVAPKRMKLRSSASPSAPSSTETRMV